MNTLILVRFPRFLSSKPARALDPDPSSVTVKSGSVFQSIFPATHQARSASSVPPPSAPRTRRRNFRGVTAGCVPHLSKSVHTSGLRVTGKMATQLTELPDVEKLSTSIVRVMGGNPTKFTLQGSNTYVLGTGPSRLLLDTAQGFEVWKDHLERALQNEDTTISTCLLSHWHVDHVRGVPDFQKLCPDAKIWKGMGNSLDPEGDLTEVKLEEIHDRMTFTDDNGFELEAVHCPGHTKDHMAFMITKSTDENEIGTIFTADNVLGHGTAVFEDLAEYMQSLHLMKARLPQDKKVRAHPGHGVVIEDASAKIQEYIDHRRAREEETLNVLRYGAAQKPSLGVENVSGKEWDAMEMVKVIYKDYPERLHEPARMGLLLLLRKLKNDGKVKEANGKWKLSEKSAL